MSQPAGRLHGRRIVVVGAGTQPSDDPDAPVGNGRAISVLAAREGAAVVCLDRDKDAAAQTAAWIAREGGQATVAVADASQPGALDQIDGDLDGLVLNVGIGRGVRLENTTPEDWDTTFAVNLRSHFLACREALPRMGEGSAIVFISSVAGLKPGSRIPAYDASKAAIGGLCRHVALEGARRGIRANVVAPGLIDTPLGRWASRGRPSRDRSPIPLGRQGTAWEIAAAVVFLLSGDASYITGQILAVDGGLSTLI
jgi:NAD(P)-dependent dehydrogenase (short-subunit alcohol dehydrogenase family)